MMSLSVLILGVFILTLSLLPTSSSVAPWTSRMSDYYNHPCKRECENGARPMICEYDFTIEYYYTLTQACHGCPYNQTDCERPHCIAADGVSRGVMTVNRMMPGPGIHVCLGDIIVVNVKNRMEGAEATTIHWHGVLQNGSPHMDGVAMVTQCPIHAHSTFQYRFKAGNAGTHYWHAHAGLQRADGIFGALVIREPRSTDYHSGLYNYDFADHTIIVNDWLNENGAARFAGHHHAMTEHLPASILINGHGTYYTFSSEPPTPHGVHEMSHVNHMAESHSKSHSEHKGEHHSGNSEHKHSNSEHKSSNSEHKGSNSEHKNSNSEHKGSNSEHKNSENKGSNSEHKNSNSEHKSSNSENKNSNSEHKSSNSEHKHSNSEHKNSNSEHKHSNSEHKNSNSEHKSSNSEHKSSNSEHKSRNSEHKSGNSENKMKNSENSMPHHEATMPTMASVTKMPESIHEGGHETMVMEGHNHMVTDIIREGHVTAEALTEHVLESNVRSKRGTNEKKSGCDKNGGEKKEKKDKVVHTPHAVFYVEQGFRYRFRIISNGVNNCPIHFSVDNHTLIVISSDGSSFRPVIVESFNLFAGERYDFVLVATNPVDNYWIRTRGLEDCGENYKAAAQTAILRYIGAPKTNPSGCTDYKHADRKGRKLNSWTTDSTNDLVNVNQLESCEPNDISLKPLPDKRFYLAMDFNMIENYRFHDPELYPLSSMMAKGHHAHHMFTPQINHISFRTPSSPPLSQLGYSDYDFCDEDSLKLTKNCKTEFCECTHRLKVNVGEVVELVVIDEGKYMDNNHPMHLHGHNFRVIGMGKLNTSTSVEEIRLLDSLGRIYRNLNKAVIKDTVNVPDGGYTIIRFHANNPGFWVFHCHIAFHMEMGMSLLIQVGDSYHMPATPRNFPRCGDWTPETQRNSDVYCPPSTIFGTGTASVPSTAVPVQIHYISNFHPPPNLELPSGVNITGSNLRNLMMMWLQGNDTGRSRFGRFPTTMRMPTAPTSRALSMNPLLYDNDYVNTN